MQKRQSLWFNYLVLGLLLFWQACETRFLEPGDQRLGFQYFPLSIGQYTTFDVEEIDYSLASGNDTSLYQLKVLVADTFRSLSGSFDHKIERFKRPNENAHWQLDSVWVIRRTSSQAIAIENNVPFIKMVFPIAENLTWNGNALNSKEEDDYRMERIGTAFDVREHSFSNTIEIIQSLIEDNIIFTDRRREIYAEDIGLIYKESLILNFCTEDDCIGQGLIINGRTYRMKYRSHGFEEK